jgi:hypothetical protein
LVVGEVRVHAHCRHYGESWVMAMKMDLVWLRFSEERDEKRVLI